MHLAMHSKTSNCVYFLLIIFSLLLSASNGLTIPQTIRSSQRPKIHMRSSMNLPSESADIQSKQPNSRMPWILLGKNSLVDSRLVQPAVASSVSALARSSSSTFSPLQFVVLTLLLLLKSVGGHALHILGHVSSCSMSWYMMRLDSAPLITKSITSGVLGICGDYLAQWFEFKLGSRVPTTQSFTWKDVLRIHRTYDLRRGLAILADGLIISGPLMHFGYNFFEILVPTNGAHRGAAAMAHVVADSIILDSIFVGSAFIMTGLMEGYRLQKDIWPQIQADYVPTLRASWATSLILMPLEFVCFRFLPLTFRTLAMNVTDIVWDTVISFMAHRSRLKLHLQGTTQSDQLDVTVASCGETEPMRQPTM